MVIHGKGALCLGDCGAGPVSCMAVKAGEAIKDRGFSGVGVAQKDNGCEGDLGAHKGKAPGYKRGLLIRYAGWRLAGAWMIWKML